MSDSTVAVVLAAGQGTRMRSALPKVLHRAAGRPLLCWVLDAARGAGCERLVVVVGHGAEAVRESVAAPDVDFVLQAEQLGTGHALAVAEEAVGAARTLLVLSGDVPLVRPETLRRLLATAGRGGALAVAELEHPGNLGRVTGHDGRLVGIVEAADATAEQLALTTVNAGLYALPARAVFAALEQLAPDNAQGELYLTDAVVALARSGTPVALVGLADPAEANGVNTRRELALVHRALLDGIAERWMEAGVTILEPGRTVIGFEVTLGADTVVHPGVSLAGRTRVGDGVTLHQGVWARDCEIADGAVVEPYSVLDGARVGPDCRVGPFARLRPGAVLERGAKVGNFVEVKKTRLGEGAKASHLSYLGDAEIGRGANVGAGVVTCNYDGESKHRTEIGEDAFVGSDTMLVAPVRLGAGATTAAGSVVTKDVPDGALAIERTRQRTIEQWRRRRLGRRDADEDE